MQPRPRAETSRSPRLRFFIACQPFAVEVDLSIPAGSRAVAQLLVPVGASLRGEVEQVPERLDRADVARVLAGVPGRIEKLGAPEVADGLAVAMEDVQNRPL